MNKYEIFLKGLLKVVYNFRVELLFIVAGLIILWRSERIGEKRTKKGGPRNKTKRIYNQKYSA